MENILEMRGVSKFFPGVRANYNVDLDVRKGEVHALLGENGAGKTTLMNCLYGLYEPDAGEIYYGGKKVSIHNPRDAIALGIGMVHQHFKLVPSLTVVENVILGTRAGKSPFVNIKEMAEKVAAVAQKYKIKIDMWDRVEDLTVGQQQRLEILKALYRGARLLILDEPTAVLTPQEVDDLFEMVGALTEHGETVILITHKLREVMAISDRITVLRLGEAIQTLNKEDTNPLELSRIMVGRDVLLEYEKQPYRPGDTILELKDLRCRLDNGLEALKGIDLELKCGEILGICGVDGNGQSEMVDAITGLMPVYRGHVLLQGKDITNCSPRQALDHHISHIPADRHKRGVLLPMNLTENVMLMDYYKPPNAKGVALQWRSLESRTDEILQNFNVKYTNRNQAMSTLSGGNQQKVVLGREIMREPDVLIAMHPARGLDIGATEYVHKAILQERDKGTAVLLVSTELEEILALSDRIAVIYEGQIMGVITPDTPVDEIGMMMAGESVCHPTAPKNP